MVKLEVSEGEMSGGFSGGSHLLSIFHSTNRPKICQSNFTTFSTLGLTGKQRNLRSSTHSGRDLVKCSLILL